MILVLGRLVFSPGEGYYRLFARVRVRIEARHIVISGLYWQFLRIYHGGGLDNIALI